MNFDVNIFSETELNLKTVMSNKMKPDFATSNTAIKTGELYS